MTLNPGDRVMMTEELKRIFRGNGSEEHVREFGRCKGIVIGPQDYNNCSPEDPEYDPEKVGPEIQVRWQPSGLLYSYDSKHLKKV
jgi:hypothetical protein